MRLGLGLGISGPSGKDGDGGRGVEAVAPQLSGLTLWLRSDLGVTLNTSNGNVSAWADQSGAGHHLSQSTAAAQPPYSTSGGPGLNGPFVGPFDGIDDFIRGSWTQSQPEHVFAVCRVHSATWTTSHTAFDGFGVGNTRRLFTPADNQMGSFAGAAINDTLDSTLRANWQRHVTKFNGVNSSYRISNRTLLTGDLGTAVSGGITLGVFGSLGGAFAVCSFAEILIYNRILTIPEEAAVNAYLTARYGI